MLFCEKIYSLSDYYPYKIYDENGISVINPDFSKLNGGYILDVKQNKEIGINYFVNQLLGMLNNVDNINDYEIITCVPGSEADTISPGLVKIMQGICNEFNTMTYVPLLQRYKTIAKLAHGGNRAVEIHLNSIKVLEQMENKKVILLDDVTTTGNSLKACTELLKDCGATEVVSIALGKTVNR